MANKKQVGEEFLQNTITEVAKLNLYRTWQRKVDYLFAFDAQAIFFSKKNAPELIICVIIQVEQT